MKKLIFWSLIIAVSASGCREIFGKRIRGNGNIQSENRNMGSFDGVSVSGAMKVFVKQDSAASVRIETDANLLEYVEVRNEGGMLKIKEREGVNLRSSRGINVYVAGSNFKNFKASGACDINSENTIQSSQPLAIDLSGACNTKMDLNAPAVSVELSGAGNVDLKGQTKDLKLRGSGSSEFDCFDLMAERVEVRMSGAGDADVFASVNLDVNVSGAGSVRYKGNASVNQRISGAGSVKKAE